MPNKEFRDRVWDYYTNNKRALPWRHNTDPYFVLVSELMLQQTQVSRVVPKFELFMQEFPTIADLADAPLSKVLQAWNGLGYNRRAKYLHEAAQQIIRVHRSIIPNDLESLKALPGIGPNTAAAILVYAYNSPLVFIETNIRSVYIHHFFSDNAVVDDKQLMPLIEATLDRQNPREWYWALMDYGTHIKSLHPNPSRRSKHYTKQSSFAGSDRQLRGKIIKLLLEGPLSQSALLHSLHDDRTPLILAALKKEKLVKITGEKIELYS